MSFFDKIKSAIRKIKNKLIVAGILFLVIIVWAIAPFTIAMRDGVTQLTPQGEFNWEVFLLQMGTGITAPWEQLKKCFTENYFHAFLYITKWFFCFYGVFVLVGIAKAYPKHEYQDIENGSSDWCEGGEQYKVLHKTKGIVLAEKNYLPVDKRGNVNVLVVRRFWCW